MPRPAAPPAEEEEGRLALRQIKAYGPCDGMPPRPATIGLDAAPLAAIGNLTAALGGPSGSR
eukprot:7398093-Pyramimonas_sp.AAC.1